MIGLRPFKSENSVTYLITDDSGYTKACVRCGRKRWHEKKELVGKPRILEMGVCDGCKSGGKTLYAKCHSG